MLYVSLIICLLGGIQGLLLMVVLKRISKKHSGDFKWLLGFIALVSVTLIGRTMFLFPDAFDPRVSVFTDLVVFFYGPLFYFFMQSVFGKNNELKKLLPHLIPAAIHILFLIPQMIISLDTYIKLAHEGIYGWYLFLLIIIAVIHNLVYLIKSYRFLKKELSESKELPANLKSNYVTLSVWSYGIVILLLFAATILFNMDPFFALSVYQLAWVIASWLIYGITYFVLVNPETFGDYLMRIKNQYSKKQKENKQIDMLAILLSDEMKSGKAYLEPDISLVALATKLDTNNVLLSKTINQKFGCNFYDLINQYRVEEFIKLVNDSGNNHKTYFGIALQAGFNSKTSFNKYFKKCTKKTPKEYFKNPEIPI